MTAAAVKRLTHSTARSRAVLRAASLSRKYHRSAAAFAAKNAVKYPAVIMIPLTSLTSRLWWEGFSFSFSLPPVWFIVIELLL